MADLLFKCASCASALVVEDSCIGQVIECPECRKTVSVPQTGTFFRCTNSSCRVELTAPASMVDEEIDCPHCETRQTIPLKKPLRLKQPMPTAAPAQADQQSMPPSSNQQENEAVQVSATQVVIFCPLSTAFSHVAGAIARLGKVKKADWNQQVIEGRIRYGLQSVKVHAALLEQGQGKTIVEVQASGDDVWGEASGNVIQRLVEALCNLGNPAYQADRRGMPIAVLVGSLVAFVAILAFVIQFVSGNGSVLKLQSLDGGCKSAVNQFMHSWATLDPDSAVIAMDPRTIESMKTVVRSIKLKRFDGKVSDLGESTWTVLATGAQYDVLTYSVSPVADMGGTFIPVDIEVSVAKDSKKVLAVKPHL